MPLKKIEINIFSLFIFLSITGCQNRGDEIDFVKWGVICHYLF